MLATLSVVWLLYSASQRYRRSWNSPLVREKAIDGHVIDAWQVSARSVSARDQPPEWIVDVRVQNLKDQPIELLDLPMLRVRMNDGHNMMGHVFGKASRFGREVAYDDPLDGDSILPRAARDLHYICFAVKSISPKAKPDAFAFATEHEEKVIR